MMEELKNMDGGGLQQRLEQLREEQFKLRFQHATGQLENTARMRQVRRDIARVKTVMNAKRKQAE